MNKFLSRYVLFKNHECTVLICQTYEMRPAVELENGYCKML